MLCSVLLITDRLMAVFFVSLQEDLDKEQLMSMCFVIIVGIALILSLIIAAF